MKELPTALQTKNKGGLCGPHFRPDAIQTESRVAFIAVGFQQCALCLSSGGHERCECGLCLLRSCCCSPPACVGSTRPHILGTSCGFGAVGLLRPGRIQCTC